MKRWIAIFTIVTVYLLTACQNAAPTPIPSPPTPALEAVVEPPATAVATLIPTLPPPPTAEALPTATPMPESAPVEEESDEGQDIGVFLSTAADFGTDRNPLTGELVDDPENLLRRPLNVKISNAPASFTRPQSGLNDADIVFEHTAEGNLTRFTAIFYGKTAPKIGPIRSARLIDIELPAMYDAALIFSGTSAGVRQRLQSSDFYERVINGWEPGYYRTGENKPYEHTLYANPEQLWITLDNNALNGPPNFVTFNAFSDDPPPGGIPTNATAVNYDWTFIDWAYDGLDERYKRWADGDIHADANTLQQVTAANVIIMSPFHVFDGKICEQLNLDNSCASYSVEIQLWGSGPATILRDGLRYDVTWHREGRNDSLTFTDSAGQPFPLKVGNTWVQLVPSWLENPVSYKE